MNKAKPIQVSDSDILRKAAQLLWDGTSTPYQYRAEFTCVVIERAAIQHLPDYEVQLLIVRYRNELIKHNHLLNGSWGNGPDGYYDDSREAEPIRQAERKAFLLATARRWESGTQSKSQSFDQLAIQESL